MARADGFENSLAYGKREEWFNLKIPLWFDINGGIFAIYRRVGVPQVCKKSTEAEASTKVIYQNRLHQPDSIDGSEETKILYLGLFSGLRTTFN